MFHGPAIIKGIFPASNSVPYPLVSVESPDTTGFNESLNHAKAFLISVDSKPTWFYCQGLDQMDDIQMMNRNLA